MAFIEPVTLRGAIATLEPLAVEHALPLAKATADGELWRLWYTGIAPPEKMEEYIATALDMRARLDAMPFVVRENATGDIVGCTRYFNVDVANRTAARSAVSWTFSLRSSTENRIPCAPRPTIWN